MLWWSQYNKKFINRYKKNRKKFYLPQEKGTSLTNMNVGDAIDKKSWLTMDIAPRTFIDHLSMTERVLWTFPCIIQHFPRLSRKLWQWWRHSNVFCWSNRNWKDCSKIKCQFECPVQKICQFLVFSATWKEAGALFTKKT